MPITGKKLSEMMDDIGFESFLRYDLVIPSEHPGPEIASVAGAITKLEEALIQIHLRSDDCFHLAIENEYLRGIKEDGLLPITMKVFSGTNGIVLRIKDYGNGFDFREVQEKYERGDCYYQCSGADSPVIISVWQTCHLKDAGTLSTSCTENRIDIG